ncbi:MAG: NAD(P)H-dependent oxidoreductase [Ahrensia sp.]|nr:NAD(P)H-dependent oxidoreductase [Ahrensia sp.]
MSDKFTILHVNSSGRAEGSYSRKLGSNLVEQLSRGHQHVEVIERDVAQGVEFVDQNWIEANFTPAGSRRADQQERLFGSDALVRELQAADVIVIGVPIYNFSVPATLKAWIDQVARANVTFRYTPDGPVGLLENKKAYVVMTSGGTEVGGPIDFASGYVKHVLGFLGITDVTLVNADRLMADEQAALDAAHEQIAKAA